MAIDMENPTGYTAPGGVCDYVWEVSHAAADRAGHEGTLPRPRRASRVPGGEAQRDQDPRGGRRPGLVQDHHRGEGEKMSGVRRTPPGRSRNVSRLDAGNGLPMKDSAIKVLNYLRQNRHRKVSGVELGKVVCTDYRSRICELQRLGYVITKEFTKVGKTRCKEFQLVLEVQG